MKKGKFKFNFKMSFLSVCVLVLVLLAIFGVFGNKSGVLFQKGSQLTLYVDIKAGEEPKLDPRELFSEKNFPEETFDYSKFGFDTNIGDYHKPGKYDVPVYYDGKLTSCVIQIRVAKVDKESEISGQELVPAT